MKKVNNYWVDENNNRWDVNIYTETQAKKNSASLINCSDCSDCSRCFRCSDCSDCFDCSRCFRCSDCSDCSDCSRCFRCSDCSDCFDCFRCFRCSDCSDCSDCSRCSDYKHNPQRLTSGLIGSRKSTTTIYWTNENDTQVICGCLKTDIGGFEKRIKEVYPSGQYHDEYMQFIKAARYCMKTLN